VYIIQALLGHASPDTVMIYAKLYPSQLIEEYRKTVRSLYNAYHGEEGLKNRKCQSKTHVVRSQLDFRHWISISQAASLRPFVQSGLLPVSPSSTQNRWRSFMKLSPSPIVES